jgi:hypothetical protein
MVPDTFRLTDEISIMKYICKEFWISLFSKQIDNLRTNNSVKKTKFFSIEKIKIIKKGLLMAQFHYTYIRLGNICVAGQQL